MLAVKAEWQHEGAASFVAMHMALNPMKWHLSYSSA